MPANKSIKEIVNIDDFSDYIVQLANTKPEHNIQDFMTTVQRKILASMTHENITVDDRVLKAYFRTYALLRGSVISRSRIIGTSKAVIEWIKN